MSLASPQPIRPQRVRIARPTHQLDRIAEQYQQGLGMTLLGAFQDHEGYDGVMLGYADSDVHFEWTREAGAAIAPPPHAEDLWVLYLDRREDLDALAQRALGAGFREVAAHNPYWQRHGRTLEDVDGHRVVLALPPGFPA